MASKQQRDRDLNEANGLASELFDQSRHSDESRRRWSARDASSVQE